MKALTRELLSRQFLDTQAVAAHFGVHTQTIYNWVTKGKLPPAVKVGSKNVWSKDDIEKCTAEKERKRYRGEGEDKFRNLNTQEMAVLLGVTKRTIYSWYKEGKLPKPIFRNGKNQWPIEEVVKAIQEKREKVRSSLTLVK
jgi:excisionase family DNA binding protein